MGTGGELNRLNGKAGISAPANSVPIIRLINAHKPQSNEELVQLIEYHHTHDCPCGIKSKGTVYDFGKNLYQAQKEHYGEYRHSLEECMQWEYDLFITNSLKGNKMEQKAIDELKLWLPTTYDIRKTDRVTDEEHRIDLTVTDKTIGKTLGIQVKPKTYKYMGENVKRQNRKLNRKSKFPTAYMYYDDNGEFINIKEIMEKI